MLFHITNMVLCMNWSGVTGIESVAVDDDLMHQCQGISSNNTDNYLIMPPDISQ